MMSTQDEFTNIRERVAVMESRMNALERSQTDQTEMLKDMVKSQEAIHRRMDKQYSFIGGIVFVITGLWAVAEVIVKFFLPGKS